MSTDRDVTVFSSSLLELDSLVLFGAGVFRFDNDVSSLVRVGFEVQESFTAPCTTVVGVQLLCSCCSILSPSAFQQFRSFLRVLQRLPQSSCFPAVSSVDAVQVSPLVGRNRCCPSFCLRYVTIRRYMQMSSFPDVLTGLSLWMQVSPPWHQRREMVLRTVRHIICK